MAEVAVAAAPSPEASSKWGPFAQTRSFLRRWPVFSGIILIAVVLVAALAPVIAPADPLAYDYRNSKAPPAWYPNGDAKHLLGTDSLGRDLLSRMIYGARVSLMVAGISLGSGLVIGTGLGLVAGYYGGLTDELVTRIVDVWTGMPFILVALVIVVVLGSSVSTIAVVLVLIGWSPFVRQIRAEILTLRTRDYVLAARVSGASPWRILFRHLLPGVLGLVLVIASFRVSSLILAEAFLSFLGAGIPPPTPSWGSMIAEGRKFLRDAWWIAVFPGIAILLTTMSMSFIGDWVRDFVDPRLRQLE